MQVIALVGNKGGAGKTTLAINLASAFNELATTVLLDADPQGSTLQWFNIAGDECALEVADASIGVADQVRRVQDASYCVVDCPPSVHSEQTRDALRISDLMRTDLSGRGIINLLDGTRLMMNPRIYATFLLWLLSELFEELPEVGDPDKPKLVFFFDEAHLLFDKAPSALLERITQVVRLIRSKGVGVFFVTQYPSDVPEEVIGQLGNRIQHALRAFTPRDRKALRAAAETFRANPAFDTEAAIGALGVGEALVSTLDAKGVPSVVERTLIAPPRSRIGPLSSEERAEMIARSPLRGSYENVVDRESAFKMLKKRAEELEAQRAEAARQEGEAAAGGKPRGRSSGRQRQGAVEAFTKSVLRSVGSSLGRSIARGILGSIIGRR